MVTSAKPTVTVWRLRRVIFTGTFRQAKAFLAKRDPEYAQEYMSARIIDSKQHRSDSLRWVATCSEYCSVRRFKEGDFVGMLPEGWK